MRPVHLNPPPRPPRLIALDPHGPEPLHEQLFVELRRDVVSGALAPGARLPSTRALASALGVSRFTVVSAMERLFAEGYLAARRGAGTFVVDTLPDQLMRPQEAGKTARREPRTPARAPVLGRRGRATSGIVITGPRREREGPRPFHPRRPPLDVFPLKRWTALLRRQWNRGRAHLDYGDPAGYRPLREAIARHIALTRGVRCDWRQVIVTSGSQQAFDILFRLLLDPGDRAWIEEPGYLDVRAALAAAGARLTPVPVDDQGLDVAAGVRLAPRARLAVVSPSHQYPTGATLSATRRAALLEWARGARAWIVEDDYDSYFRYRGRPMSSLQGTDSDGPGSESASARVLYVGTFSKTMFPSLRLGFAVVPEALIAPLANARAIADRNSPPAVQAALAEFIDEGHYDRHLRRVRRVAEERHEALRAHAARALGGMLSLGPAAAGTHVLGWLEGVPRDHGRVSHAAAVARAAAEDDLVVFPLSRYCLRAPRRDALVLGYGAHTPEELEAGIETLARVIRTLRRRS